MRLATLRKGVMRLATSAALQMFLFVKRLFLFLHTTPVFSLTACIFNSSGLLAL